MKNPVNGVNLVKCTSVSSYPFKGHRRVGKPLISSQRSTYQRLVKGVGSNSTLVGRSLVGPFA